MITSSKFARSFGKISMVALSIGAGVPAIATTQNSPAMVAVGNGAPLIGSSSSPIGVSALTPQVNGNPNSVRLLGTEKTAGVSTTAVRGSDGRPTEVQSHTPIDGTANSLLPR